MGGLGDLRTCVTFSVRLFSDLHSNSGAGVAASEQGQFSEDDVLTS